MSEKEKCPYCGAPIENAPLGSPDESVMITCPHCGGRFEYIVGFGAFTPEGAATAKPLSSPRPEFSRLREMTARPAAKIGVKRPGSTCCECTVVCCMILFIIVLFVAFVALLHRL